MTQDQRTTLNPYLNFNGDCREARNFFGKLSDGGSILMPFERTFWGADFGMCADRFGIQRMVSFESPSDT